MYKEHDNKTEATIFFIYIVSLNSVRVTHFCVAYSTWDTSIIRQNPLCGWILIMTSLNWISPKSHMSVQIE